MAYLSNFYEGTTLTVSVPISKFSAYTLNAWSKLTLVVSDSYGGSENINLSQMNFQSETTAVTFDLTTTDTNMTPGNYVYEIFFEHDTAGASNYDTEIVIESSKVRVLERV